MKEQINNTLPAKAEVTGSSRTLPLARWISDIGSPPALGAVAVLLSTVVAPSAWAWLCAGFYMLTTVAAPLAYIVRKLRRGDISDIHLPLREERMKPLIVSLVLSLGAWAVLITFDAPRLLRLVATVNLIQTTLFLVVTARWKMSLHSAVAAALAALSVYLGGQSAMPIFAAVPLIGWSRVYLKRHTVAQVVGGASCGFIIFFGTLYLFYWS